MAADTPWLSMAVDSYSIYLGDNAGTLEEIRGYRISFAASFSSNPAVQELSRFIDVFGIHSVQTIPPPNYHKTAFYQTGR
jgi:hypothetical protein